MIYVILALGVLLVLASVYGYKLSSKTAVDYLLAGRSIGTIVMFFYVYFAISSAWTFYGFAGMLYNTGPAYMLYFTFASFAFLYIFVGPKLWAAGKKYGYFTPLEYLGERYNSKALRVALGVVLVLFSFPYLGLQAVGIGAGMQAAVGFPFWFGASYLCAIMLLICLFGGIRTVAWLNVLLGAVFTVTFFGFLFWIMIRTGNTDMVDLARRVQEIKPGLLGVPGPGALWGPQNLLGLALAGMLICALPHIVMGTMQAKNTVVMRKMAVALLVFSLFFCNIAGIWGYLVAPTLVPGLKGKAADAIIQVAITKYLPAWASGGTLLAVLAAAISTVTVQLMMVGLFISRDIVFATNPNVSGKKLVIVSRVAMLASALVSFFAAMARPAELGMMLSNLAGPGFALWMPALLGGIFWKRGTKQGAVAGLVVGAVWLIIGSFFYKPAFLGFHPIIVPLVIDTILYMIISMVTSPVSKETQYKFFEELDDYLVSYAAAERISANNVETKSGQ
jgi:SSS family solute:Na+ symporter